MSLHTLVTIIACFFHTFFAPGVYFNGYYLASSSASGVSPPAKFKFVGTPTSGKTATGGLGALFTIDVSFINLNLTGNLNMLYASGPVGGSRRRLQQAGTMDVVLNVFHMQEIFPKDCRKMCALCALLSPVIPPTAPVLQQHNVYDGTAVNLLTSGSAGTLAAVADGPDGGSSSNTAALWTVRLPTRGCLYTATTHRRMACA